MVEVLGKGKREEKSEMNVVRSPRAIRHLIAIKEYIEKDSDGNAALIAARILDAIDILRRSPRWDGLNASLEPENWWCPGHRTSFPTA
jgi:hypothetical protein